MTTEKRKTQRKPPYVAKGVLWQFFNKLKFVAMPPHIDAKELEEYGIPKAWAYHLLSTLKYLNLVERNGKTTPALQSLQMKGDEFKHNLEDVVRNAYADLFLKVDPAVDSRANIMNFFMKRYNVSSTTAEKATTLFLDLCGEAGIPVAEQIKKEPVGSLTKRIGRKEKGITPETKAQMDSAINLREVYARKLIESNLNISIGPGMDAEAIKVAKEILQERHKAIQEVLQELEHQGKK